MGRRVVRDQKFYNDIFTRILQDENAFTNLFDEKSGHAKESDGGWILHLENLEADDQKAVRELFGADENESVITIGPQDKQAFEDFKGAIDTITDLEKIGIANFLNPNKPNEKQKTSSQQHYDDRIRYELIVNHLFFIGMIKGSLSDRKKTIEALSVLLIHADLHDKLWAEKNSDPSKQSDGLQQVIDALGVLKKQVSFDEDQVSFDEDIEFLFDISKCTIAIPILKSLQSAQVREALRREFKVQKLSGFPTEKELQHQRMFREYKKRLNNPKITGTPELKQRQVEFLITNANKAPVLIDGQFLKTLVTVTGDGRFVVQPVVNPILYDQNEKVEGLINNESLCITINDSDEKEMLLPPSELIYKQGKCEYGLRQEVFEIPKPDDMDQSDDDMDQSDDKTKATKTSTETKLTLSSLTRQNSESAAYDFAFRIRMQVLIAVGLVVANTDEEKKQQTECVQNYFVGVTQLPADIPPELFRQALIAAGFLGEKIQFIKGRTPASAPSAPSESVDDGSSPARVGISASGSDSSNEAEASKLRTTAGIRGASTSSPSIVRIHGFTSSSNMLSDDLEDSDSSLDSSFGRS